MKQVICKDFTVSVGEDTFTVTRNGIDWVTLPVRCCVDRAGSADEDENILSFREEQRDGTWIFTWTTVSNNWREKQYVLKVTEQAFLFTIVLKGQGAIEKIRYFTDADKTRYEVAGYVMPHANHTNKMGNTRLITENEQIRLWYAAPTMYVYPFYVEGEPGSLGLGLVAKPGQYNFDVFHYVSPMQFSLPLYHRTVVEGSYETQGILGLFADSEEQIFRDYTRWHFENGYANPHQGEIPAWWKRPIYCGWGEQMVYKVKDNLDLQRDAATQKNYTEMMAKLEKEHLNPGSIIIDSKWQTTFGGLELDTEKWPDMRKFVDEQHAKGRKVILWIKSWDPEGLSYAECIKLLCNGVAADPTSPAYIGRVKDKFYKLLSSDEGCYDCDGFKVDFVNCIPQCGDSQTHTGICGVELIKAWMKLVYDTAKAIKPDALVNTSCAHPYFTENVDMPRIHDYMSQQRSAVSVMNWRKEIFSAANPGMPIDMDSGGIGSKRDFHRYMRYQAENGVPTLYWLNATGCTPLECVPFDEEDFDVIRECWNSYEEKLSKGEK